MFFFFCGGGGGNGGSSVRRMPFNGKGSKRAFGRETVRVPRRFRGLSLGAIELEFGVSLRCGAHRTP